MTSSQRGLVSALSANIIWGFTSIPIKALKNYSSEQILFSRIVVSLIICGLYVLFLKKSALKESLKIIKKGGSSLSYLIILSGIFITLNWYAFIYVVNHVNLRSAAFAYMVCPIITALAGFFILKEQMSQLKFIGIGLALISIVILSTGSFTDVLWSVIIALFYTLYLIVQRLFINLDKIIVLGLNLLIALIITIPLFFGKVFLFSSDLNFWMLILSISILFTLIPLFLSLYSLKTLNSSTAGILIYINPVVAFSVAFLYFHEGTNSNQIFAYALIVIAVVVFNWKLIKSIFTRTREIEG